MNDKLEKTLRIPGRLIRIDDFITTKDEAMTFPTVTAEIYPRTPDEVRMLINEMHYPNDGAFTYMFTGAYSESNFRNNAQKLSPERIIHSGPATIVFWNDKTKTVVKCSENDIYDEYEAFCAALAIKLFGSNSHLKKMIHGRTKKEVK